MIHRATPVQRESEFAPNSDDDDDLIGPAMAGTLMTPEEFDALEYEQCNELYKYELINGVLIVTPTPDAAERGPNELIGHLLRNYAEQHPQGTAMNYTLPEHMIASRHNRRRCDRAIWAGLASEPDFKNDVPTIAIELVSKGKRNSVRDYEVKREEYVEAGIAEYWIIDRFRRQMTIIRSDAKSKCEVIVVAESETYGTPLLPGFELPLARVLAEADWTAKRGRRTE